MVSGRARRFFEKINGWQLTRTLSVGETKTERTSYPTATFYSINKKVTYHTLKTLCTGRRRGIGILTIVRLAWGSGLQGFVRLGSYTRPANHFVSYRSLSVIWTEDTSDFLFQYLFRPCTAAAAAAEEEVSGCVT